MLRLCTGDVAAKHWRRCVFRLRDLSGGIFRRLQRLDKLHGLCFRYILDHDRRVSFGELFALSRRHVHSVDRDGDVHELRGGHVSGKHGVDELLHVSRRHVLSF